MVILEFLSAKLLQGFFGNKKIANDTDNSSRKNKEKIAETLIKWGESYKFASNHWYVLCFFAKNAENVERREKEKFLVAHEKSS